jgi:hypothetical protein
MATMKQQPKWMKAQVREHIRKITEITQKHKRQNKKAYFVAITLDVIEEKFKRVNSPMIVAQGWGDVV